MSRAEGHWEMSDKEEELQKLSQLYATWSMDDLVMGTTVNATLYAPEAVQLMRAEIQRRSNSPAGKAESNKPELPADIPEHLEGRQPATTDPIAKKKHGVVYHMFCGLILVALYGCMLFIAQLVALLIWMSIMFSKGKPNLAASLIAMLPGGKLLLLTIVGFILFKAKWFRCAAIPAILLYSFLFCLPLLCFFWPQLVLFVIYAASMSVR